MEKKGEKIIKRPLEKKKKKRNEKKRKEKEKKEKKIRFRVKLISSINSIKNRPA